MSAPARGAYLVDEATRQLVPPEPPWVGRVQTVIDEDEVRLVTPRGIEWTARIQHLRLATEEECGAYDAAVPRQAQGVRS
ncbi:hypothetical protein FM076_02460 [Streptomyces albus subsp. chlorinus]|uniref:hypothetical protein n=1 Tax=Streptomyces albus TaxID=1888 RepID=UPI00156FD595|nr:hypothetical protein [Streptomyces albus]NSC20131.1 hypothetical protein [Streptomyces albus subsp. chlorinus]